MPYHGKGWIHPLVDNAMERTDQGCGIFMLKDIAAEGKTRSTRLHGIIGHLENLCVIFQFRASCDHYGNTAGFHHMTEAFRAARIGHLDHVRPSSSPKRAQCLTTSTWCSFSMRGPLA